MKVSGFTFVRNAVKFDYPVVESIKSILPICDEVVVAVGDSDDGTLDLIKSIDSSKVKIIETIWDDSLREGGKVLAVETDKAFAAIDKSSDWAFYIQGDEVIHEDYLASIKDAMARNVKNKNVEGLLFKYKHFYGSYDYVGNSRRWYRNEIRIVRNDRNISSFRDAQGFRKNNVKLKVRPIVATMFHYGWVKPPDKQQAKQESFHTMWHDDEWVKKNVDKVVEFDYSKIDSVEMFKGTHPAVMEERVRNCNWPMKVDPRKNRMSLKVKMLGFVERVTGWRVGEYKNYKVL